MRISLCPIFCFLSISLFAQQRDLKNQGITSALHQTNLGKIIFTDKEIPLTKLAPSDFLSNYELTNKSNLFITVFMANSATNYLHRLAPELSTDSVVKIGNYQFTLFIDGKLIYQSNLFPGAPQKPTQDTATVISKPLIDNQRENGLWSQSFWNRFLNNGGDAALTEGKHLLRMEIRPYLKMGEQIRVGELIASGNLTLQVYRKPKIDISQVKLNPIRPYNGLPISTSKLDTNLIKSLKGNIEANVFKRINGVVILERGKILVEEYFNGEDRTTKHDPRSVGKSFASTMTGIAIRDGYLKNENQTLNEFYNMNSFENYEPQKANTKLSDLLTMSSVFDGDDGTDSPGNEENMYPAENWVKFTLDLPIDKKRKPKEWHYFTAGVVVLGDILHKVLPGGLENYADKNLFKPLGITNYEWQHTPQQVANTAGGIRLTALDFAKYGQLYKNHGIWKGKQLIPTTWVDKTFTKYRSITDKTDEYYGYLFWNKKYIVNGKSYETFYCSGNGGNKIFVFKDQPWVVVVTASAYNTGYAHPQVDRMITEFILPALINSQK